MIKKYDVAISFAGEDRAIAQDIAAELKSKGIVIFYDDYEKADLWGKDLYEHLISVYQNDSKYCLMLISESYTKKLWTSHERKAAQARAFRESKEYILPLRLDDADVTGILETTGYLDFRSETIASVCSSIEKKLWGDLDNDQGIQLLKSKIESIYNRLMLICNLVLVPSVHPEFGRSSLAIQLYPTLVHNFADSKSQILLTAASFDKLILANLTKIFDHIERLLKIISFLICRLDPQKNAYDFIMEIPEAELNEVHDFLKRLKVFDNYAVKNVRYFKPDEVIENWKKAEVENSNICFTPSEYVITQSRKAYVFDFALLSKIHCKIGDLIETYTD